MENQIKAAELKEVFDEIVVTPIEAYSMLVDFLDVEAYRPNSILQHEGELEESSRFILSGIIGLYKEGRLERLFFPNQIAVDFNAYQEGRESRYAFVTLTEVRIIRLTKENETAVLKHIPEIKDLSGKLKAMVMRDSKKWVELSQKHYKDIYIDLVTKLRPFKVGLTEKQWSSLLGIDVRTLRRYKRILYESRHTFDYKLLNKDIFDYPFESKLHDDAREIEILTYYWAYKLKILPSAKQRKKFNNQKLAYLSAVLYPEASLKVSVWISSLYLLLFIMDDYTDSLDAGEKAKFWKQMLKEFDLIRKENPVQMHRRNRLASALAEKVTSLKSLASSVYYRHFLQVLEQYIRSNEWEASNKDKKAVPTLEDYLENRPFFSGGNLALQLIPFTLEQEYPDINQEWYRLEAMCSFASKLIFISNDMISYEKERRIGDYHNWMELLIIHKGMDKDEAKKILIDEHEVTLSKFIKAEEEFMADLNPVDRSLWAALKAIKYQISGTVEWSVNISTRYKKI